MIFLYLLIGAILIIACIISSSFTHRIGVPTLLGFIILGMLMGSDGIVGVKFNNFELAQTVCTVALIFIMFYGGFSTNWQVAAEVSKVSVLLSSVGTVITALLTGVFSYVLLGFPIIESLLIGALLSSTDAASVFSILRSKKLNLKYKTASILELESGSNDPFAYMLTMIILSMMGGDLTLSGITSMLLKQVLLALLSAGMITLLVRWLMENYRFEIEGFDTVFIFSVAILAYAVPDVIGGNGYLSAYLVGILLGNYRLKNKKNLVAFFDGITGLMQMLVFFLLGLLSEPLQIVGWLGPAIAIAFFMTFAARPLAISLLMTPFHAPLNQQLLISFSGLRGAASIVFAIIAGGMFDPFKGNVFHIVFGVVLVSILLQGGLLETVAKKLSMIDENEDVMRTFSDFTDETDISFLKLHVEREHRWANCKVKDIIIPPDTLMAMIERGEETLIPNGETVLLEGDRVILSAKQPRVDTDSIHLIELLIRKENTWVNHTLAELARKEAMLILMVQRGEETIVPGGSLKILEGDRIFYVVKG